MGPESPTGDFLNNEVLELVGPLKSACILLNLVEKETESWLTLVSPRILLPLSPPLPSTRGTDAAMVSLSMHAGIQTRVLIFTRQILYPLWSEVLVTFLIAGTFIYLTAASGSRVHFDSQFRDTVCYGGKSLELELACDSGRDNRNSHIMMPSWNSDNWSTKRGWGQM